MCSFSHFFFGRYANKWVNGSGNSWGQGGVVDSVMIEIPNSFPQVNNFTLLGNNPKRGEEGGAEGRQACSSQIQIQYLSKSTKITTNIETGGDLEFS